MGLKKLTRKVKRSWERTRHGKFHAEHVWYRQGLKKILPQRIRSKLKNLTWGHLKKSHSIGLRHLTGGNNNASSLYVSAGGYQPGGYVYNGRSISEMM